MDKKAPIIIGAVVVVVAILIVVGLTLPQSNNNSNDYKVTYDCNGGSYDGQTELTYNEKTFVTFTPSRDGYDFDGWYKNKDDWSGKMTEGDALTSDIKVYAKWNTNYKLYLNGITTYGKGSVFSIEGKTGTEPISIDHKYTGYSLPDSGKTRLIATSGSEFTIIKDSDNNDSLRFKVEDNYYYTMFEFTDANNITYKIDSETGMGYVEFEYSSSVDLSYAVCSFIVKYNANGGSFGDTTKDYKDVKTSTTVLSDTDLSLTPPAEKQFAGWYTAAEGGDKVEEGSTVSLVGSAHLYVELYAHYQPIPA